MSSLREIKDRIASVRSTLKITSAMKLVASSKLRKAQNAIEALRPYEETISDIIATLGPVKLPAMAVPSPGEDAAPRKTIVVAFASNSSLCGGFNANAVKKTLEVIKGIEGPVEVIPVGRKMAEAMKKAGFGPFEDHTALVGHPGYQSASALASALQKAYFGGEASKVLLVYNHFVSTAKQVPVCETYLPLEMPGASDGADEEFGAPLKPDFIIEPSASEIVEQMLPQVLGLKFYAAILDSCASEHAARTVAMQTATDNANDLLAELTLEYNKGRQQKITAEILDLVGGASA